MDWYPWYPLKFRRKTYSLSLAEDGAYRRLIDEYMMAREPLPGDDLALARILGITLAEWGAVSIRVRGFFKEQDGRLINKECEDQIRVQDKRKTAYSDRGKKAAFQRWSKINGQHARRMLVPATIHNKERKKEVAKEENGKLECTPELQQITQRKWLNGH